MGNEIITRIALTGDTRGAALLKESEGGTELTVKLKSPLSGALVYAYGANELISAPLDGESLFIKLKGVCAVAVVTGGRIAAAGFLPSCKKNRARLLDEIRIRSAEQLQKKTERIGQAKQPAIPGKKSAQTADASSRAQITEEILEKARYLFGALNNDAKKTENEKKEEHEPLDNPFPKTFPNSIWRENAGGTKLIGVIKSAVGELYAEAVPIDLKNGRARIGRSYGRVIPAKDGRRYLVIISNGKP